MHSPPIQVRFYDAAGKQLPPNAIPPVKQTDPTVVPTALAALHAAMQQPTQPGETMGACLLRIATPYVQLVYGVAPA
jgi:hypothetical protein